MGLIMFFVIYGFLITYVMVSQYSEEPGVFLMFTVFFWVCYFGVANEAEASKFMKHCLSISDLFKDIEKGI